MESRIPQSEFERRRSAKDARADHNKMLIDRVRGIPGGHGGPEHDPTDPNVRPLSPTPEEG